MIYAGTNISINTRTAIFPPPFPSSTALLKEACHWRQKSVRVFLALYGFHFVRDNSVGVYLLFYFIELLSGKIFGNRSLNSLGKFTLPDLCFRFKELSGSIKQRGRLYYFFVSFSSISSFSSFTAVFESNFPVESNSTASLSFPFMICISNATKPFASVAFVISSSL